MKYKIFFIVLLVCEIIIIYKGDGVSVEYIDIKELNENSFILDVRTKEEVNSVHLTLPFIHMDSKIINVKKKKKKYDLRNKNTTVNILCYSGRRAEQVAKEFIKNDYSNVKIIKGGIQGIEKENIKVLVGE